MRSAILVPVLLSAVACSSPRLSSEKRDELKKALAAFKEIPDDMHGSLAAAALAEIESERLPKPLIRALEALSQVSPAMRAAAISKGLAESLDALQIMCQGEGIKMMKAMAEQSPNSRLSLIREQCKTDRFKLVPDPSPSTDAIQYLLAHVVLSHLEENGGTTADERVLIKYLATAQAPAPPN